MYSLHSLRALRLKASVTPLIAGLMVPALFTGNGLAQCSPAPSDATSDTITCSGSDVAVTAAGADTITVVSGGTTGQIQVLAAGVGTSVTVDAGGTVTSANGGSRGLYARNGGAFSSILNNGTISGSSNASISFEDTGGDGSAVSIVNNGTIGSTAGTGIGFGNGYDGDVTVTNNATISSNTAGISTNITATNQSIITNAAAGLIEGQTNRGMIAQARSGVGTINNAGIIRSVSTAGTAEEGFLSNAGGGTLNVTNSGTISSVVDDAYFVDGSHTHTLDNSGTITTGNSTFRALVFEPNLGGSVTNTGTIDGHVESTPSNGVVVSFTQTAGVTGSAATDEYVASGTHAATFSGGAINLGLIRHGTAEDGEVLTLDGGLAYTTYPSIDGWETAVISTAAPYVAAARGATTRNGTAANVDVSAFTFQIDTEVVVDGAPLLGPGDAASMTVDMSNGGTLNFQDGATDDVWNFGTGTGGGNSDIGAITGGTVAMDMAALGAACTTDLIATNSAGGTLTHTGPITLDLATAGAATPTTQTGYCMFADQGNDGADSFAALVAGATPTDVSGAYTLGTNPFDTVGYDYHVIEDADGNAALAWVGKVGIVVSKTTVATAEAGTDDTFTVVLEGPPPPTS